MLCVSCYKVSLQGAVPFKGFLIQARVMADDTVAVGSFLAPQNASADYAQHNCSTDQVSYFVTLKETSVIVTL